MDVRFPDGTHVRASGVAMRLEQAGWREHGLYCDAAWAPDWPAELIDWPDFGIPTDAITAAGQIERAFQRARSGVHVEVGCIGGRGRTGTVLACMAVLAGVPAPDAVAWVRANYDPHAVETREQEAWVGWFAGHVGRG